MKLTDDMAVLEQQAHGIAGDWDDEDRNVIAYDLLAQAQKLCQELFPKIRDAEDLEVVLFCAGIASHGGIHGFDLYMELLHYAEQARNRRPRTKKAA